MFKNNNLIISPVSLILSGAAGTALAREQYTTYIKTELVKWGQAVKVSGVKVE